MPFCICVVHRVKDFLQDQEARNMEFYWNSTQTAEFLKVFLSLSNNMQSVKYRYRSSQMCSVKKVFLEISQNSQKNTWAIALLLIKLQTETCNFIKKETLTKVFSCEFCEISKDTFPYITYPVAASVVNKIFHKMRNEFCF